MAERTDPTQKTNHPFFSNIVLSMNMRKHSLMENRY